MKTKENQRKKGKEKGKTDLVEKNIKNLIWYGT